MSVLRFFNRQKTRPLNLPLLRKIGRSLLGELSPQNSFALGIHLIDAAEMTRLNETFLQHRGSTDVITFNYAELEHSEKMLGEIFISVDDAIAHARLFRTTWQSEVVRYFVHGILHLQGYDDLKTAPRQKMKREENRLLKKLSREFDLGKLERSRKTQ